MGKVFKNTVSLLIIILYCFIISGYSYNHLKTETAFSKGQSSDQKQYYSLVSDNLFCHTVQSEDSVNFVNNFPTSSPKDYHNYTLSSGKAAGLFISGTFLKYIFCSRNFIIKFRQTDIIFPFHYFW